MEETAVKILMAAGPGGLMAAAMIYIVRLMQAAAERRANKDREGYEKQLGSVMETHKDTSKDIVKAVERSGADVTSELRLNREEMRELRRAMTQPPRAPSVGSTG